MTGLYSINLRIAGSANVPIFNMETIFSNKIIDNILSEYLRRYEVLIITFFITICTKILLDLYLNTKSGYLLRAVGNNSVLVTTLAKDSGNVKILGLVIANALVALGGSIMMQQQGFFEITMGTGAMVLGLASVIIGTNLFKKISFIKSTTAVILGSVLYKASMSIAMDISFTRASDMKLVTSVLFLIILIIGQGKKKKVKSNA
jgi:putative ABC transport system permease protein